MKVLYLQGLSIDHIIDHISSGSSGLPLKMWSLRTVQKAKVIKPIIKKQTVLLIRSHEIQIDVKYRKYFMKNTAT
jgi:hypothetical protein